jgi:hypothetical protein
MGHGQNSSKFICVVLFVIRVVFLLIVLFCVMFVCKCVLPPGVNPIAVDKYIKRILLLARRFIKSLQSGLVKTELPFLQEVFFLILSSGCVGCSISLVTVSADPTFITLYIQLSSASCFGRFVKRT